jgi:hypothetical protein
MISWVTNYLKSRLWVLSSQSGFVSSGQGMAPGEDRIVNTFVGSLLGALCGLLCGFILSHFLRFISYLTGRYLGGFSWVLIGALAGAVLFGCLAFWRDDG